MDNTPGFNAGVSYIYSLRQKANYQIPLNLDFLIYEVSIIIVPNSDSS